MDNEVEIKLKNHDTGEFIKATDVEIEMDSTVSINTVKGYFDDPEDNDSDNLSIGGKDWTAHASFDSDELASMGLASDTSLDVRSDGYDPLHFIDDDGFELYLHHYLLPDNIDLYVKVNSNSNEESDW